MQRLITFTLRLLQFMLKFDQFHPEILQQLLEAIAVQRALRRESKLHISDSFAEIYYQILGLQSSMHVFHERYNCIQSLFLKRIFLSRITIHQREFHSLPVSFLNATLTPVTHV